MATLQLEIECGGRFCGECNHCDGVLYFCDLFQVDLETEDGSVLRLSECIESEVA